MSAHTAQEIVRRLALATTLFVAASRGFAAEETEFSTDISLADIMASIVMPAADALWKAVSVDVGPAGEVVTAPQTDEEWSALRNSAVTLAAATNLLLVPRLPIVDPTKTVEAPPGELAPAQIAKLRNENWKAWTTHTLLLHETALQALKAIDSRDVDGLSNVGGDMDAACESCHLQYWYPQG